MSDDKEVATRRKAEALSLASGRWPDILSAAGMPSEYFRKSNGPCPFCEGTDRYRWSEKHGGVWVCTGCTGEKYSDGFSMLMRHLGIGFGQAVEHVLSHFNGGGASREQRACRGPSKKSDPKADLERSMKRMTTIWTASRPIEVGDPVDLYLKNRVPGLDIVPQMVRFHPALDYWAPPADEGDKPVLLGTYPAMISKAFDARGNFVQIHKTYLTADGRKADVPKVKKLEIGVGASAFVVPMMRVVGDTLGISEGLETGLASAMFKDVPVWSCLSGPSMAGFEIPASLLDQINRVIIFADNDEFKQVRLGDGVTKLRSPGSHYAAQAAQRVRAQGKRALIVKALRVGTDMANQWVDRVAMPA